MKNVGNTLDSREPGMINWPVMTLRLVSHRWLCSLGGIGMSQPETTVPCIPEWESK